MLKRSDFEIMAPVGSRESLYAAIKAKADAVYFGGQDFSLRANAKNFSWEDIKKATKISQIHNSIQKFQKGYDTPVGERGTTLSGGQKQRVAIARSLILNSPILIFDDSLSAVDTETDYNIRQELKNRDTKSTTLIITHRIATAKDADLIVVLNNGKIEAIGKHEDLVEKDGMYQRIYKIQTKME